MKILLREALLKIAVAAIADASAATGEKCDPYVKVSSF
jgi:hypothetical protein